MQPEDKRPYQAYPEDSEPSNQPIVTLSSDEDQADGDVRPESEVSENGQVSASEGATEPVRWQASEYVHREKDQAWFALFVIATIALTLVAIFLIKSKSFAVLVPIMAFALIIYSRRPPRVLDYTLGRHGLYINDQLFPFGEFKSFALVHGLDQYSIMLIPVKRFKPAITVNFPEEAGEAIIDMLAPRLPMTEMQPDIIDRIIRKLHL